MDDKKIILDKYPSYSGKTKFITVIFLMNFVRVKRVTAKNVSFRLVVKKNVPALANEVN
jgi:hypothetical protein